MDLKFSKWNVLADAEVWSEVIEKVWVFQQIARFVRLNIIEQKQNLHLKSNKVIKSFLKQTVLR